MAIETPHLTQSLAMTVGTGTRTVGDERETAPIDHALAATVNALAVLDHRSRRRTIAADQALPGRYLGFQDGDGATHLLPIDAKIVHIGRASNSDLRLEHMHVSRRHAILVRYGRHVRVLDDRSSAGTFVNGLRVVATDLDDGDVIVIGPVAISYVVVR
jgi:hypothetical protein